jgi:hypothetical protein
MMRPAVRRWPHPGWAQNVTDGSKSKASEAKPNLFAFSEERDNNGTQSLGIRMSDPIKFYSKNTIL